MARPKRVFTDGEVKLAFEIMREQHKERNTPKWPVKYHYIKIY